MQFKKIEYTNLSAKQREIYNFQKLAAVLADYGFNCIKLSDDWQGADFLAFHKDEDKTLRVQLKGRLTIAKKYLHKNLYMAFPFKDGWCLVDHDVLVNMVSTATNWLQTQSWLDAGDYHASKASKQLSELLQPYYLS